MAVKTITITQEAYNSLSQFKGNNKSFSEVIVEITADKKGDAGAIFGILKNKSKDLDLMADKIIKRRKEINKDFSEREKKFRERLNDTS